MLRLCRLARPASVAMALTIVALVVPAAQAQKYYQTHNGCTNCYSSPTIIYECPSHCQPCPSYCQPCPQQHEPEPKTEPKDKTPDPKVEPKDEPTTPTDIPEPSFSPEQAVAGGMGGYAVAGSSVGYIDSAIVRSQFRIRYDSAFKSNRPDRAEFFYPKCGCFRIAGLDPNAKGPPPNGPAVGDFDVDYNELTAYLEAAVTPNLSGFIEVPYRTVNFSLFPQEDGFSDLNFGVKAALINNPNQVVTFQFRTYVPTGDGEKGLGTEHVTLEPALLAYRQLSPKLFAEGEFRYWIPIDGSDFAGDVIRYGVGLSAIACQTCSCRVMPVVELVGWTVLDGQALGPFGIEDASGDTIVNAKFGIRVGVGPQGPGYYNRTDFYVGYGRALTGDVWYEDVIRLEYRVGF